MDAHKIARDIMYTKPHVCECRDKLSKQLVRILAEASPSKTNDLLRREEAALAIQPEKKTEVICQLL